MVVETMVKTMANPAPEEVFLSVIHSEGEV